jgi:phage N-6-adenine-methyltransferase
MTELATVDAQVLTPLDEVSAKRLDQRIRLVAGNVRESLTKIATLLAEAKAAQIHESLGFRSWTAYLADALGGQLELPGDTRQELVALLAGEGMSTRAIATATGASKSTVSRDIQVSHRGTPDAGDPAPAPVTGLDGKTYPKPEPKPHLTDNSRNCDWYTPRDLVTAAASVMGGIDLDPASCAAANETVGAAKFYTAADDGLSKPWTGRVWLNPPYSQPLISQFSSKLLGECANGNVREAIVLVHNATETGWFQELTKAASAICFLRGRVTFQHPTRTDTNTPPRGHAVIYFGSGTDVFAAAFGRLGLVLHTAVAQALEGDAA